MNSLLSFLITTTFLLWAIRNILFWVALWQVKEYRFDRLLIHIKDTIQGRSLFLSKTLFIKIFLIILFIAIIKDRTYLYPYRLAIATIFCLQALFVVREIVIHTLKRPALTFKAFIVVFMSVVLTIFFTFTPFTEVSLWLLLVDRLIPFIVIIFVVILAIPTELYRDYKISAAIDKIQLYKKALPESFSKKKAHEKGLLIIGVTGSFGKSSTKEYIAQILGRKFNVVKTKGSNNTPIAIANTILSNLTQGTEVFVVEMGAYKRGEIAMLCQIAPPTIGVLTAISAQHLSLFGSLENTMRAKYELIEALPKEGLAIFNGTNIHVESLYKMTKKKKILYQAQYFGSLSQRYKTRADMQAVNIAVEKTQTTFDIVFQNKILHLKTPLVGRQAVENIIPAVYLALYFGMTTAEIKKAVSLIVPLDKTMVRHVLPNGTNILDDTFNTNPESVLAVLSYLKIYKGKKVLILQPMIELAGNAKAEHYLLGKEIGRVCDFIFLTNKNFYREIKKGIDEIGSTCSVKVANSADIASFIQALDKNDVVICEGKEAATAFHKAFYV